MSIVLLVALTTVVVRDTSLNHADAVVGLTAKNSRSGPGPGVRTAVRTRAAGPGRRAR